jgi:hypothetical protein
MFPQILLASRSSSWPMLGLHDLTLRFALVTFRFVAVNQPFTIWLMRSFFDACVPRRTRLGRALTAAAEWRVFFEILLRSSKSPAGQPPSSASCWASASSCSLVLSNRTPRPLPLAIAEYGGEEDVLLVNLGHTRSGDRHQRTPSTTLLHKAPGARHDRRRREEACDTWLPPFNCAILSN